MANRSETNWRTEPMYTIGEAARLAHVSAVTVRRWLYGYAPDQRSPDWRRPPVFGDKEKTSPHVSFLQLIEVVVASDFRKLSRVSLDRVRVAHANARQTFAIAYPFAHDDLALETLGGHIVHWLGGVLPTAQAVDSPEQFSLPGLVAQRIEQFDYEQELAARWYPAGKEVPIVVDPQFSAGLPTVIGRGVTVQTLHRRWLANQPISFIASDLEIDPELVERALQYAEKVAA